MLPHHQDTGGFFIALLEKSEWLPWQKQRKQTKTLAESSDDKSTPSELPTTLPVDETVSEELDTTSTPQDTTPATQDTTSAELSIPAQDITDKDEDTTIGADTTEVVTSVEPKKESDERPSKSVLGR